MILFWIGAAVSLVGLAACLWQVMAVRRVGIDRGPSGEESPREAGALPAVSILKPLCSLDDALFDNLESFCHQDYPEYEIILALQDRTDPAYRVALRILEQHPGHDITLLVEKTAAALNPKVNNLLAAYRRARHPVILISDSNVRVAPDYLRTIVGELGGEGVGLVSNPIRGVGERSLGALFENLHLNTFVLGGVCFMQSVLKMPCVVGKSMLMRKMDLERIGGLQSVLNVLAEDYLIGRRMHEAGRRVVLSRQAVDNVNRRWELQRFLNRHSRWGQMRCKLGGWRYVSELLGNPVFTALVPLLAGPRFAGAAVFLGVAVLKVAVDCWMGRLVGAHTRFPAYLLGPVKDILIGGLWFVPLFSRKVSWRGHRYSIGARTELSLRPGFELPSLHWRQSVAGGKSTM